MSQQQFKEGPLYQSDDEKAIDEKYSGVKKKNNQKQGQQQKQQSPNNKQHVKTSPLKNITQLPKESPTTTVDPIVPTGDAMNDLWNIGFGKKGEGESKEKKNQSHNDSRGRGRGRGRVKETTDDTQPVKTKPIVPQKIPQNAFPELGRSVASVVSSPAKQENPSQPTITKPDFHANLANVVPTPTPSAEPKTTSTCESASDVPEFKYHVQITVGSGNDLCKTLPTKDYEINSSDGLLKLVIGDQQQSTKMVNVVDTPSPVWDESFTFGVEDPEQDKVKATFYLGEHQVGNAIEFNLSDLVFKQPTKRKVPVFGGVIDVSFCALDYNENFKQEKENFSIKDMF